MAEVSSSSSRAPTYIPGYTLGTEAQPTHFAASTSREAAATEAKSLSVGDAAFIKRSDLKWTYAIVTEKVDDDSTVLRFEVDKDQNRKSFPEAQWGKYIRVVKIEEAELAKLKEEIEGSPAKKEEGAESAGEEDASKEDAPKEEATPEEEDEAKEDAKNDDAKSTSGNTMTSKTSKGSKSGGSSWFSPPTFTGLFGSSSKKEEKKGEEKAIVDAVPEETKAEAEEEAKPATEESASTSVAAETTGESTAVANEARPATPPLAVDTAAGSEAAAPSIETSIENHVAGEPRKEDPAVEEAPAAPEAAPVEPDNTKENSDPKDEKIVQPPTFLPIPRSEDGGAKSVVSASSAAPAPAKETVSVLKNPLKAPFGMKKKGSLINKMFKKDKTPPKTTQKKVFIESPKAKAIKTTAQLGNPAGTAPMSPKEDKDKKEWFDPEAREVDYDKNPTDLFQALEARQFSYADEMFSQANMLFTKECRTWVVARGQKKKDSSQLRFRALPLHAALVFGAPDDMIKKILNAYPKATRGRDVKGRLPIHLAMEHNASEEVVSLILEAFPKGFLARDKKDLVPLDYVNGNMTRGHMKKYIPLITSAKVEDERAKWEAEMEEALEAQKVALKSDAVYMEDVITTVTDDVETAYATKMGLLEGNYQKEIQLLKKKHDSETQALLEGFEVKLNFERKLQKLKSKA